MSDMNIVGQAPKVGLDRSKTGRAKGTPNKTTTEIKTAIIEAFEKAGGVEYLVKLAAEDPRTFCALVGKVIPLQVTGDPENPVGIIFQTVYEAKK